MLILYNGPYENLSFAQQQAIHNLTVRRYVEDIYRLEAYLQEWEGLAPGTPEFERAYAAKYDQIQEALATFDDRTYVSAILQCDICGEWSALASMRSLWGLRADMPVARSIGCADSSIPTHRLLRSFQYPRLPDFDPDVVTEAEVFEPSRLVASDYAGLQHLVNSGAMAEAELHAVLAAAFDELLVAAIRNAQALTPAAGFIFNVKPKLATALRLRKGFNLVPLYSEGVEPTPLALNNELDRPYFRRWHAELLKLTPPEIAQNGIAAAVRYMAGCEIRQWHDCEASLPYLLVNNAELEPALQKLEAKLARRPYAMIQETAYAGAL